MRNLSDVTVLVVVETQSMDERGEDVMSMTTFSFISLVNDSLQLHDSSSCPFGVMRSSASSY